MNLNDLVSPESVVCTTDIASKKRALETLAELLAKQAGNQQTLEIFQQLTEREKLGSTALGHGVALPHARTELCDKACGAFIKLEYGIDFDSPDGKTTDLLFALLVPEHYTDEHLQILATLAKLFSDNSFCDALRSCTSNTELHSKLTA
jgi:PTS system nitrogen regulatory IIA component